MKLSDITFKDEKKFEFLDPITGKSFKKKVFFTILSPHSKEAKNSLLSSQRAIFELMQNKDNLIGDNIKPEIAEAVSKKYLASLIKDWENVTDDKGKPLECNESNRELFIENDFVSEFVGKLSSNLANFR